MKYIIEKSLFRLADSAEYPDAGPTTVQYTRTAQRKPVSRCSKRGKYKGKSSIIQRQIGFIF